MSYKGEEVVGRLRSAREAQKLSQREASARSGLTQSHISHIERGTLDPGLSSLIDLARALDLELVLVPKKLLPAVTSVIRTEQTDQGLSPESGSALLREIEKGERLLAQKKVLYGGSAGLDRMYASLRFLRRFSLEPHEADVVRQAVKAIENYNESKVSRAVLDNISNYLVTHFLHGMRDQKLQAGMSQPGYALPDDED